VKDVAGVMVEVKGEEQREKVTRTYTIVHNYNEEYGVSALAYLTGVPLSIASQMLAREEIREKGVLPSDLAVEPSTLHKSVGEARHQNPRDDNENTRALTG